MDGNVSCSIKLFMGYGPTQERNMSLLHGVVRCFAKLASYKLHGYYSHVVKGTISNGIFVLNKAYFSQQSKSHINIEMLIFN